MNRRDFIFSGLRGALVGAALTTGLASIRLPDTARFIRGKRRASEVKAYFYNGADLQPKVGDVYRIDGVGLNGVGDYIVLFDSPISEGAIGLEHSRYKVEAGVWGPA